MLPCSKNCLLVYSVALSSGCYVKGEWTKGEIVRKGLAGSVCTYMCLEYTLPTAATFFYLQNSLWSLLGRHL